MGITVLRIKSAFSFDIFLINLNLCFLHLLRNKFQEVQFLVKLRNALSNRHIILFVYAKVLADKKFRIKIYSPLGFEIRKKVNRY